jgi:hypothetical protein
MNSGAKALLCLKTYESPADELTETDEDRLTGQSINDLYTTTISKTAMISFGKIKEGLAQLANSINELNELL